MKDNLNVAEDLGSEIVKIVATDADKYEIYFDFLSIPVEVNESYLNTIIEDLKNDKPDKVLN